MPYSPSLWEFGSFALFYWNFSSVQFSCLAVSDSLQPHGLQHARPPYPSPTPGVYSDSCPLSQWPHPTISSSVIPNSSHLWPFPASGSSNESVLHTRWPKYWSFSFSISPSSEYRTDLLSDGLTGSPWCPRDSQESSPTPHCGISVPIP